MDFGDVLSDFGSGIADSVTSTLTGQSNTSFVQPPDVQASVLFAGLVPTLKVRTSSSGPIASLSLDDKGARYQPGFSPEVDYYVQPTVINPNTHYPVERGNILTGGQIVNYTTVGGTPRDTNDILDNSIPGVYNAFDDGSGFKFLHELDENAVPIGSALGQYNDIYLTSFVETNTDNEDPISFGYDLVINYANSPLFNGAVENFISTYGVNYAELQSRLDLITDFKQQFFKFFNIDSPSSLSNIISKASQPRTYYIKKISGLDNLTEDINSDKSKQFVDYGNDYITLTMNEDVSVNMGYLASLYKILTWSKIHGKKMIPDNLLRFDLDIIVTESRKFNRVYKNSDSTMGQYPDPYSVYRYTLYECQFFFGKMSHGDTIDMWNLGTSDGFDIKFNYKFSTLNFQKFLNIPSNLINSQIERSNNIIDNSQIDLSEIDSSETNSFSIINNSIILNQNTSIINHYYTYGPNSNKSLGNTSSIITQSGISKKVIEDFYAERLINMNSLKTSNVTSLRAQLLQQTLINIASNFSIINLLYGGFTADGWEYNIPGYLANQVLNLTNNTLPSALGSGPGTINLGIL